MEWAERVKNCKTLPELRETAKECETVFKASATQMVFADGNPKSKIMFIGEAPGRDADKQGKPFVGESGEWLNSMLDSISLARKDVYITNTVLWRPPPNFSLARKDVYITNTVLLRPPPNWRRKDQQIEPFLPILRRHVELVAPEMLICLGGVAANALLNCDTGILTLRGEWHEYTIGEDKVVPVMPTPHPSYFLREPHKQDLAQNDFNLIAEKIRKLNLMQ